MNQKVINKTFMMISDRQISDRQLDRRTDINFIDIIKVITDVFVIEVYVHVYHVYIQAG